MRYLLLICNDESADQAPSPAEQATEMAGTAPLEPRCAPAAW